jgi:hypothetical protein
VAVAVSARAPSVTRALLGRAVVLTVVTGGVALGVAAVTGGADAVRASLVALTLVLGFLLLGQLPVSQAARGRRGLGAALLLFLYTTRIAVLLLAFRVFYVSDDVDRRVLGATVIACALGWTAGTVWSALRWRPMLVEPEAAQARSAPPEDPPERW